MLKIGRTDKLLVALYIAKAIDQKRALDIADMFERTWLEGMANKGLIKIDKNKIYLAPLGLTAAVATLKEVLSDKNNFWKEQYEWFLEELRK